MTDIPTTDYPTPAKRPLNSRMDCSALEATFGITRPDWREGLAQVSSGAERVTRTVSLAPPSEKIEFDGERCTPLGDNAAPRRPFAPLFQCS